MYKTVSFVLLKKGRRIRITVEIHVMDLAYKGEIIGDLYPGWEVIAVRELD